MSIEVLTELNLNGSYVKFTPPSALVSAIEAGNTIGTITANLDGNNRNAPYPWQYRREDYHSYPEGQPELDFNIDSIISFKYGSIGSTDGVQVLSTTNGNAGQQGGGNKWCNFTFLFAIDRENEYGYLYRVTNSSYWDYNPTDTEYEQVCGTNSGTNPPGLSRALYNALIGAIPKYAGGAGSGYIGNPLLSNKKMVGYNVPTSSSASTKTLSTDMYNSVATYDVPKEGNGFARIRYLGEPGRKIKTLIDASENIKDAIFDNIVTIPSNDFGNDTWQFDQNGILFINEKNRNRASINAKFFKGSATKLYIEVLYNHRSTYGSNYRLEFMFLDDLYSGECVPSDFVDYIPFISHTNQYNIIGNDPWYDLPKTTIEISLNNIPINQIFYISFASCDGHTEISKIYFDDNAYIIQ